MNKIILIATREFKNRVQKKSFLLATILLPLIFPAIMGVLIYVAIQQEKAGKQELIHYVDESKIFKPDTSKFQFKAFHGTIEEAKKAFEHDDSFGLLHIPNIDVFNPKGVTLYTKVNPSPSDVGHLEWMVGSQFKEVRMRELNIDKKVLDSLNTNTPIATVKISEGGQEKSADTKVLFGVGMACGILMYMFIFIYGAQIMQGIIE